MKVNFNLLYLILQKALGKGRESHLNTGCRRPANGIPMLCAPITRAHPRSRDPCTPADPPLPGHTRRPRPVPEPPARSDGVGGGGVRRPRGRPQSGAAPPRGDSRGARQGALRAHEAPTAPRPPWGPGPASSPCLYTSIQREPKGENSNVHQQMKAKCAGS